MVNESEPLDESATGESSAVAPAHRRARHRDEQDERQYSAPVQAALARGVFAAAGLLPYPALYRFGGWMGATLARVPSRERHATRANIALCFPGLDAAEQARLVHASLIETGRTLAELAALWCWPGARTLALVREVRGRDVLDAARARGRGVIVLAPHLGAWELVGLHVGSLGPMTSLYKPPRIREMEAFYTRARERIGARLVPADAGGVRALHRALKAGEAVGILPDQDPGRGSGVFVPFFGVLANTTTLLVKLVQRTGAAVVLTWAERLPDARGFRMHFCAPVDEHWCTGTVEAATAAMNREVERLVRTAPTQYLWSYKRFRYRPAGEPSLYRRAGARDGGGRR